jgi:hypothetical protein
MFRADPVTMGTEFIFQVAGSGVAPMFQDGVRLFAANMARTCDTKPEVIAHPETILGCMILSAGRGSGG